MEKMVKSVGSLQNMGENMQNMKRNPHEAQKAMHKMQQAMDPNMINAMGGMGNIMKMAQ